MRRINERLATGELAPISFGLAKERPRDKINGSTFLIGPFCLFPSNSFALPLLPLLHPSISLPALPLALSLSLYPYLSSHLSVSPASSSLILYRRNAIDHYSSPTLQRERERVTFPLAVDRAGKVMAKASHRPCQLSAGRPPMACFVANRFGWPFGLACIESGHANLLLHHHQDTCAKTKAMAMAETGRRETVW